MDRRPYQMVLVWHNEEQWYLVSSKDTIELRRRILILTYNRSLNWYLLGLDTQQLSPAHWRSLADVHWIISTLKDIVVLSLRGTDTYVGYIPEPTAERNAAPFSTQFQTNETFLKWNHNFSSKALHILLLYLSFLPHTRSLTSQVLRSLWIQNPTSK